VGGIGRIMGGVNENQKIAGAEGKAYRPGSGSGGEEREEDRKSAA